MVASGWRSESLRDEEEKKEDFFFFILEKDDCHVAAAEVQIALPGGIGTLLKQT